MVKQIFKEMNKVKLIFICIILIMVVFVSIMLLISTTNDNKKDSNDVKDNVVQKIDQMENYDYYLDENATDYYKELYDELKIVLNNETVNDEEYVKIVSKLFVTDLFTLDNKLTSSDIGGLQFVFSGFKDDFVNIAKTTLYSSVESNIYGDRNQRLPIVNGVEINSIETSLFTYENNEFDSYNVNVSISYEKDLGYPNSYSIVLVKSDRYFQVVAGE